MNDALLMRGFKGFRNLLRDVQRLIGGNWTSCYAIRKGFAFD
jgi:hypothetical protein